jgi:uncharacterized C2H2 Zn-finger protein
MPRTFDSDEHRVRGGLLTFAANVDCPACELVFEGVWVDDSFDAEQVTDAPEAEFTCPRCDEVFEAEYPGFINYGDAG